MTQAPSGDIFIVFRFGRTSTLVTASVAESMMLTESEPALKVTAIE